MINKPFLYEAPAALRTAPKFFNTLRKEKQNEISLIDSLFNLSCLFLNAFTNELTCFRIKSNSSTQIQCLTNDNTLTKNSIETIFSSFAMRLGTCRDHRRVQHRLLLLYDEREVLKTFEYERLKQDK